MTLAGIRRRQPERAVDRSPHSTSGRDPSDFASRARSIWTIRTDRAQISATVITSLAPVFGGRYPSTRPLAAPTRGPTAAPNDATERRRPVNHDAHRSASMSRRRAARRCLRPPMPRQFRGSSSAAIRLLGNCPAGSAGPARRPGRALGALSARCWCRQPGVSGRSAHRRSSRGREPCSQSREQNGCCCVYQSWAASSSAVSGSSVAMSSSSSPGWRLS